MAEALRWVPRFPALRAEAAAVVGQTAALERAIAAAQDAGRTLAVDQGENVLVVRVLDGGPPLWVDGVRYFGRSPRLPQLWLPTAQQPLAPPELLWSALSADLPGRAGELLLWPGPPLRRLQLAAPWPLA